MSDTARPQNRKQRRATERNGAAKKGHLQDTPSSIKLAQPDRSGPKGKTLVQLAEERQALLDKGQPFSPDHSQEKDKDGDFMFNDDPLGPVGEAILYCSTLSMLHFTLDVLVFNQYRQEIVWKEIFARTGKILPILFLLIYMLHSKTASRFPLAKQLFFLAASVAAGCYMIFAGNTYGYFAVMKRAPPVGTLWVWSVVEMELGYAVASLLAVGGYMWWGGFKIF